MKVVIMIVTGKQVYIDYNPSAPFWVHDKLIGDKKTELFISNYTHNPFLKDSIRAKIEKLKVQIVISGGCTD